MGSFNTYMYLFILKKSTKMTLLKFQKQSLLQENKIAPAILKEVYFCEIIYLGQSVNKV